MFCYISCFIVYFSILASLNLPAALEDLSGQKVPQSVIEKAQQIKDIGGIQFLNKLMSDLPELLQRNREILNEVHIMSKTCMENKENSEFLFANIQYLGLKQTLFETTLSILEYYFIKGFILYEIFILLSILNVIILIFLTVQNKKSAEKGHESTELVQHVNIII